MKGLLLLFTTAAVLGAGLAMAQDGGAGQGDLPALQQAAGGSFICGGIGLDESTAIKQAAPGYPLQITFAADLNQRSAYVACVSLNILNASGQSVLQTACDSPYLLARLPAGQYTVSAEYAGQTKNQRVTLTEGGHQQLVFLWSEH